MEGGSEPNGTDLGFQHLFIEGTDPRTLLLLHGTGGDENQLLELARQLAPESALLSPRGKVLEGGVVRRFFKRHGPRDLDVPDLIERTDEMARFIADARTAYGFESGRVVALGYSNGANIAVSLLLRRPEALAGAVLFRATLPFDPPSPPPLRGKRVLVLAGERDPYVPRDRYEALIRVLREGGADVATRLGPSGHELTMDDIEEARGWLAGPAT